MLTFEFLFEELLLDDLFDVPTLAFLLVEELLLVEEFTPEDLDLELFLLGVVTLLFLVLDELLVLLFTFEFLFVEELLFLVPTLAFLFVEELLFLVPTLAFLFVDEFLVEGVTAEFLPDELLLDDLTLLLRLLVAEFLFDAAPLAPDSGRYTLTVLLLTLVPLDDLLLVLSSLRISALLPVALSYSLALGPL